MSLGNNMELTSKQQELKDLQDEEMYQDLVLDRQMDEYKEMQEEMQPDPYQELMANEYRIVDEQNKLESEKR